MELLKLIVVDKDMNTVEIEVNLQQWKMIGIDLSKVKKHKNKRELNNEVKAFLDGFKNE